MILSHSIKASLLAAALFLGLGTPPASAKIKIPPVYVATAELHGIADPSILYAIAMQESGKLDPETDLLKPWPWALNVDGEGHYFDNMTDVWNALAGFLQEEPRNIGIGLVQVTWPFNANILWEPYTALDPGTNLTLGAIILRDCYDRLGDWWRAVGCYHSPTPKLAVGYRQQIYRHWLALQRIGAEPS